MICDQATVTVTVNAVNDGPTANDDTATTDEDTPVVIDVTGNDTDSDGTIDATTVNVLSGPTNGSVTVDPVTGDVTYTPNAGYSGSDSFTYEVCDNGTPVICDQATVSINVEDCLSNALADCDGDGVTNGDEIDPDGDGTSGPNGTDPIDPCAYTASDISVAPSAGWLATDCDGDGVTNGDEIADGTNPIDPCDLLVTSQTVTPSSNWNSSDCDNDGITNGDEITNGSDPFDPCSPKLCGFSIPEAFTPDGDGINDSFVIVGIEKYPGNEITILNRWGNLVFETSDYKNDWDGRSQSKLNVDGDALPTGTYYYILDTKDPVLGVLRGYIYLQR